MATRDEIERTWNLEDVLMANLALDFHQELEHLAMEDARKKK